MTDLSTVDRARELIHQLFPDPNAHLPSDERAVIRVIDDAVRMERRRAISVANWAERHAQNDAERALARRIRAVLESGAVIVGTE